MNYQTYQPHPDLSAFVKCYWTLDVSKDFDAPRQRIVPDGCIEMAFILGDDIKRYTSETDFILQPRAMVIGQITEPFFIEPMGYVNTFAIRFYPYAFAVFVDTLIEKLANQETPIKLLFEEKTANDLEKRIVQAIDTQERIAIIETLLLDLLNNKTTIDKIVSTTVDILLSTKGNASINEILKNDITKRRQLERKFRKQIGISPKQLARVIRLQAALNTMLNEQSDNLISIAYETEYYDQAHFIRDFKEFTGTTPKDFLEDSKLALSTLFYKNP